MNEEQMKIYNDFKDGNIKKLPIDIALMLDKKQQAEVSNIRRVRKEQQSKMAVAAKKAWQKNRRIEAPTITYSLLGEEVVYEENGEQRVSHKPPTEAAKKESRELSKLLLSKQKNVSMLKKVIHRLKEVLPGGTKDDDVVKAIAQLIFDELKRLKGGENAINTNQQ